MKKKYQQLWIAFFFEIAVNLKIPEYKSLSTAIDYNEDPLLNIIEKYKNHLSVTAIKNVFPSNSFVFETVSRDEIPNEIKNLDSSKATPKNNIPKKIVKENAKYSQIFHILLLTNAWKVEFSFLPQKGWHDQNL